MMMRLQQCLMVVAFVMVAGAASAQDTGLLTYDISMPSALQMNGSTYVLPPGEYRLEQFDKTAVNLFMLRQKQADGTWSDPLAILDAWRVPHAEVLDTTVGVKMRTEKDAGGLPVITGWQLGAEYWRLRDVATLDTEFFASR